jgi:outer membrane protein assembly factor BamB
MRQPAWLAIALLVLLVGCSQSTVVNDKPAKPPPAESTPDKSLPAKAAPVKSAPIAFPATTNHPVRTPLSTIAGRDWPLMRGDPLGSGVAQSSLPAKLDLLWKFQISQGAFVATPIVVDGTVYIGDLDNGMYAIELASGLQQWKFTAQAGFYASVAYRQGRLYVGDGDGLFYCLDAAHGKALWTFRTGAEIDSSANFYHDHVLFGSEDSSLYCLDAANKGKKVWSLETEDQVRCTSTVVDDRVFVAGCDGKFRIVDVNNGKSVKEVDIESPTGNTPAVQGSMVYFGNEGGTFFAIDWKQAKIIWQWADKARTDAIRSSAAVVPEAIIFGTRDKHVHAFAPLDSHHVIWNEPVRGRIDSSPVVADNRVFVGSSDGRIYGFDRHSGKIVWRYEAGGDFTGSPAVADHRMVIASGDGIVYCFGAK